MADKQVAEVQAELQEYLQVRGINGLFVQLVENLLIEKPENPIAFIVEFLWKKYPQQAMAAAIQMPPSAVARGVRPASAAAASANAAASRRGGTGRKAGSDNGEDEDEGQDGNASGEESDEEHKLRQPRMSASALAKRRSSVSSESVDPARLQSAPLPVHPKSAAEEQRLLGLLAQCSLFCHLDEPQRRQLALAMVRLEKAPNEVIIRQGDPGDLFFIVEEGSVRVFKQQATAASAADLGPQVAMYGPGDMFGELAIMHNAPRAASCVAGASAEEAQPVTLWALDRASFRRVVLGSAMARREAQLGFLRTVPVFAGVMSDYELCRLSDALEEAKLAPSAVICRQGEAGDTFFLVKEGEVVCTQRDAAGRDVEVGRLRVGSYFGEVALLTTKPRQATVRASPSAGATVLSVSRSTFQRLLGPLEDILKRNMELYASVQARQEA